MLKIFHAPRTRSHRIVWLCEEMGVPYEIAAVKFTTGAQHLDRSLWPG